MNELFGDLWGFDGVKAITTNGTVRQDGACVMGKGVAYQAKAKYPTLPHMIGKYILNVGNRVGLFYLPNQSRIITFPVKHQWYEKADLDLIRKSVTELEALIRLVPMTVFLPRPGCGNGGLLWADVKPLVEVLPDNVYIVEWKP